MSNFFSDNDDLQFYFERGIDWAAVVRATERLAGDSTFATADEALAFYRQIAEMVGEFVAEQIAPHAAEIDREGVSFREGEAVFPDRLRSIFEQLGGLELHGMCLPRELGGMNAPLLLYLVNTELMARAEVSVMAHHGFHSGIAMCLLLFSVLEGTTEVDTEGRIVRTRFGKEIAEIARGDAWGCMDITEPDAGSDMASLRAVGELGGDGRWYVSGPKIFVTSGHGKYHFVIARTEKAGSSDDPMAGLQGLSLFMVPTYEDLPDGSRRRIVPIDRVEEKLGHHGSVTANLTFERAPAELIGKRGEGFQHMLTLMNGARLGVGFESIGLCESAYRMACAYAAERKSMGKTIDRHEMIADYLEEMRTDIQGLRAIAMHGAVHDELGQKIEMALRSSPPTSDAEKKRLRREAKEHRMAARRVTPLLKYLAAEKAVEMARRNVQIHGGNGYMTEYGAEKLLRDAVVMPIYEGTSQIQALMAMKDALSGVMNNPQAFLKRQAQARWRALGAKDPLERRVAHVQVLAAGALGHLITRTAATKLRSVQRRPIGEWKRAFLTNWDPKRDFALAMLHAERLTRLLADEHVCEVLLDQARRFPERRELAERYLERAEPRCRFLHDEITSTGGRLLGEIARSPSDNASAAE